MQSNRKHGVVICLLIIVLLIGTRFIGLRFNMEIHPDEDKFYQSVTSLLHSLLDPNVEFKEVKEYPEGAYLFQLPFQALGVAIGHFTGSIQEPQVWGRIASVFYLGLSGILGMAILDRYLGKSRLSAGIFGLTLCFSLFFIEHSRYGVGDMISLFLLLLIIVLTAKGCEKENSHWYLLLAFAACGAMGSVKYPQVIFGLIPLSVFWYDRKRMPWKLWKRRLLLYGLTAFVTFLLFSPKAMFDWRYFYRVIRRESDAYLISGTTFEAGGFLNHIAAMTLYSLLYADFPLAILLLILCFSEQFRNNRDLLYTEEVDAQKRLGFLFSYVVPGMTILFFVYNLIPTLLIYRTYTPFFGLSALYCSNFAGKLVEKGHWRRYAMWILMALMILRGAGLMFITASPERAKQDFGAQVYQAADENWSSTILLGKYIMPFDRTDLKEPVELNIGEWKKYNGSTELTSGTLVVTGAYPFALAEEYLIPANTRDAQTIAQWQEFVQTNSEYFVGQSYPDFVYYLFGGWLRGGTLSTSMIPCNYIYYCP